MDFDEYNFDKIIMEKIIPLIKRENREILNRRIKSYLFISLFPSTRFLILIIFKKINWLCD